MVRSVNVHSSLESARLSRLSGPGVVDGVDVGDDAGSDVVVADAILTVGRWCIRLRSMSEGYSNLEDWMEV